MRIIILLLFFNSLSGQNKPTRDFFYPDKSVKRHCEFKTETNTWTCVEYYTNGKVQSVAYYDTTFNIAKGTKTIFGLYGELAYTIHLDEEKLMGPFTEYYCNGQIKMKGYFYNSFRVGNWQEYYPTGILKSSKYYTISRQDSLLVDYSQLKDTLRRNNLRIRVGEFSELKSNSTKIKCLTPDSLSDPVLTDVWFAMDGIKTGTWTYYNRKGKLTHSEKHK
jgi:antitoxin component YwqK of YwqJK toxin-antitoxin module